MNACKQHRDPTKLERDREGERKSTLVQHGSSTSLRQVQRTAIDALFFFFFLLGGSKLEANSEVRNFWVLGGIFGDSNYTPGVNLHPLGRFLKRIRVLRLAKTDLVGRGFYK